MIALMLNNLRRPSAVFLSLPFKIDIFIFYFYFLIAHTFSYTIQRQASFFCLILSVSLYNLRIEHRNIHKSHIDCNDRFIYPVPDSHRKRACLLCIGKCA